MTAKQLVIDITTIQAAIDKFHDNAEKYLSTMKQEDFDLDGQAIRDILRKTAKLDFDLAGLSRRLE
jgi:hypothetical protein